MKVNIKKAVMDFYMMFIVTKEAIDKTEVAKCYELAITSCGNC